MNHPFARRAAESTEASSSLELFFDLVFAFTITQVSHLLIANPTWQGALQSAIVLLGAWWSWNYTTWLTDELDGDTTPIRLLLIGLMALGLLMAVAIPGAFGSRGLLFAGTYVAIQFARHGFLAFVTARAGTPERTRALHILAWFLAAGIFWIAGGFAHGTMRIAIWMLALVIDYGGPICLYRVPGRPRLASTTWQVHPEHFADRYAAFVILTIGETIAITGATMTVAELTWSRGIAFVLTFLGSAAFWWLYFGRSSEVPRLLADARDRTLLARYVFVYGHVALVAGILLAAVGDDFVMASPLDPLPLRELLPVVLGPVVYLLTQTLILRRLANDRDRGRVVAALAVLAIGVMATVFDWPAMLVSGAILAVVAVMLIAGQRRPTARPLAGGVG